MNNGKGKSNKKRKKQAQKSPTSEISPESKRANIMADQHYPPSQNYVNNHGFMPYGQMQPMVNPNVSNFPFNDITSRLERIEEKLGKLNAIESKLTSMEVNIKRIDNTVKNMDDRIKALETSRQFDSESIEELKSEVKKQSDLASEVSKIQSHCEQSKRDLLDLQTRSMRDNLVFFNIPENDDPSAEDCKTVIKTFCEKELKMEDIQDVKLDRAHRLGQRRAGKTRPIVAKFNYYPDRERVRQAAPELKGTPYGISEQFPKEIQARRKILADIMKVEKKNKKKCSLSVDKLFIEGKLYMGPEAPWTHPVAATK
jgi:archaellum component FlaC